ncbi:MAG: HAD family hydrolase [Chloroflexota bacterium]
MGKCLIFDCDGTLVDSELLCHQGLAYELDKLGVYEDADSMMHRFRGWKLANIFEQIEEQHSIQLPNSFEPQYRKAMAKLFASELKPITGAHETLSRLPHVKCVASSGPMHKIIQALEVTNLRQFFDNHLFSAYDVGSWKPDPDLFLHAADQMGFNPDACVVIEDSLVGIQAARAAGMRAIFFNPNQINLPTFDKVEQIQKMSQLTYLLS